MDFKEIEMDLLVRMHQKGLVAGRYRSTQDVRRSIGWQDMASRRRERAKFDAIARKLVKKGVLTDHGKSMRVLSLTPQGDLLVKKHLEGSGGQSAECP